MADRSLIYHRRGGVRTATPHLDSDNVVAEAFRRVALKLPSADRKVFKVKDYLQGRDYDRAITRAQLSAESAGGGTLLFEEDCMLFGEHRFARYPIRVETAPGATVTKAPSQYGKSLFQFWTSRCSAKGRFVSAVPTASKTAIAGSYLNGNARDRDAAFFVYVDDEDLDGLDLDIECINFVCAVTVAGGATYKARDIRCVLRADTCTQGFLAYGIQGCRAVIYSHNTDNSQPTAPGHAAYISTGGMTLPNADCDVTVFDSGNIFSGPGKFDGVKNGHIRVYAGPSVRLCNIEDCEDVSVLAQGEIIEIDPSSSDTNAAGIRIHQTNGVAVSAETRIRITPSFDSAYCIYWTASSGVRVLGGEYRAVRGSSSAYALIRGQTTNAAYIKDVVLDVNTTAAKAIHIASGDKCAIIRPKANNTATNGPLVTVDSGVNDTVILLESLLLTNFVLTDITDNGTGTRIIVDGVETVLFTPTMTFATPGDLSVAYNTQYGRAQRIGTRVHFTILIDYTPTYTTSAGNLRFEGLPFAADNNGTLIGWGCTLDEASNLVFTGQVAPHVVDNTDDIEFFDLTTAGASAKLGVAASPTGTNVTLHISGSYEMEE